MYSEYLSDKELDDVLGYSSELERKDRLLTLLENVRQNLEVEGNEELINKLNRVIKNLC
mgnify:CR=1 FL=1